MPPTDLISTDHLRFERTPMPMAAMAVDYAHNTFIASHRHRRAQLLYAIEGVMIVAAPSGRWVVPPTRGVWLAAGLEHTVQMSGNVKMRTVFVEPDAAKLPQASCVVDISPLVRELILAAIAIPLDYAPDSRDARLMRLLLDELTALPVLPLYLPWPRDARLARVCDRLVQTPADAATLDDWAREVSLSAKTFQRRFAAETGITFGRWRQQARLLQALEALAHGEKIVNVALDHGYASQSAFAAMFKRHFGVPPSAFYR
ncbi:AraC family transcriptional regulator [Pandoraea iniqua]|uniref:AraC family transcriptional regulator n=1 Tax=Pandoraea iniqua TaxID=2508288 RepID=A0A5E4Y8H0_9BURK|nr:helix-turn-helix transcriptional regulator [Pandoraea iniqua]VVE24098.1 AraC family transcriptional regulator [Pandoraea iniqua]VVE45081.1 AraC family transcriptional regulator [Pandoraea iniqua]